MMEEREEISAEILMDATEMITCLIISRNLDTDRVMPTFQKGEVLRRKPQRGSRGLEELLA